MEVATEAELKKESQMVSSGTENDENWPSRKLEISVHDVSSYKDDYRPENALVSDPNNPNSRWSVDFGAQQQYIIFKLNRPAILDRVFFGKFEKVHTSSLRRFRISVGLRISAMTELITGELNHRNVYGETFPLPVTYSNRTKIKSTSNCDPTSRSESSVSAAADNLLPSLFVKLEPLATPILSADYCSLWYIELHGVDAENIVLPAIKRVTEYQQVESYRLMLKIFRQMRLQEPYEVLCRTTGISLEAPELTQLHALLVDQKKYVEAEKVIYQAAQNGLFDEYVAQQAYQCRWQEIKPALPIAPAYGAKSTPLSSGEKVRASWPGPRGGHAMCVDMVHRQIFVFGGWDGKQDLADFWVFNIDTNTWKCLSNDTLADGGPCARSCHRMVIDTRSQTIYMTGRFVDVRTIGSHHLDHENIIPSMPVGHGNGNVLVGGRNDFYSYDVERNEWRQISSCTAVSNGPRLLFDHAMCIDEHSGIIYIFGGNIVQFRRTIDGYQVKTGRLSGMYAYHIKASKWQCLQRDASDVLNTRVTANAAVESSVTTSDTAASVVTATGSTSAGSSSSGNSSNSATAGNNPHHPVQQMIFHVMLEPVGSSSSNTGGGSNSVSAGGEQEEHAESNNSFGVSVNFAQQVNAVMAQVEEEQQAAMLIADYEDVDEEAESMHDAGHHQIQHLLNQHHIADGDDDDDEAEEDDEGDGDDDVNEDDNSTVKDDDDEDDDDDEENDSDVPPPLSPLDLEEPSSPSSTGGTHDAVTASQNSNTGSCSSTATHSVPSKHSIPLRVGHCMLFHPKRRVLYIFGGRHGAYDLNDFVTYDPARHECLSWAHSSSAPTSSSVRGSGLMQRAVLDAERDEIYVHFGLGRDTATHICIANASTSTGGTSAGNNNNSTSALLPLLQRLHPEQMQSVLGPSALGLAAGRQSTSKAGESVGSLKQPTHAQQRAQVNMNNSLWLYKIGTGEWSCFFSADAKRCGDGSEPCARYAHQILYDSATRRLFMFGGNPSYTEQRSKRLNDLWRTSLVRYSRDDVVRKCVFRIRVVEYLTMLHRMQQQQSDSVYTTFDVLNYLQTKLAPCVAAHDIYSNNNMPESDDGKKHVDGAAEFDADDEDDRRKLHTLANMLFSTTQKPSYQPAKNVDADRNERLKVFQYISKFIAEDRTEPREDLCDFIRLRI